MIVLGLILVGIGACVFLAAWACEDLYLAWLHEDDPERDSKGKS